MAFFQPLFSSGLSTETSPHGGTQPSSSDTGPNPEDSSAQRQSSLPGQSLKVHWTELFSRGGRACGAGAAFPTCHGGGVNRGHTRKHLAPGQILGMGHRTRTCGTGEEQLGWDFIKGKRTVRETVRGRGVRERGLVMGKGLTKGEGGDSMRGRVLRAEIHMANDQQGTQVPPLTLHHVPPVRLCHTALTGN